MLKFLERQRMVKKGLACQKTRRRRTRSELGAQLECGMLTKVLLIIAFLAGLATLIYWGDQTTPASNFMVGLLVLCTALTHLWITDKDTFQSNSRLLLILGVFLIHLTLLKIPIMLVSSGAVSLHLALLAFPFAFAPLIFSVLLGRNYGLFGAIFASLWGAVLLDRVEAGFLIMSLICGFVAVFATLQVRRRSRLIRAGIYIGVAGFLLAGAFGVIGPIDPLAIGQTDWGMVGTQSMICVSAGIMTAMLVGGLLPVLESCFKITTEISWLELADLNHPLLRRMTIEAPGTYHHSLVVANLAESAAEAIGANATQCRVSAYFHDIGKLVKPNYFTENAPLDENPHDDLTPTMSALIIIAHVKEGVDLALKHKLNQEVIDAIQQHHGTSAVAYFYRRALQQQADAKMGGKIMNMREGDIPAVKEESFRYAGPKPQNREIAILSLADSIESASRSLEKPSPQKIEQLINEIIDARIADRQLDECGLTLNDIRTISDKFLFTLRNMMHSRIAYPKEEKAAKEDRRGESQQHSGDKPVSAA